MQNWKRLLIITTATLLGLAGLLLAVGILFTDLVVDYWWHSEIGMREFFWLKLLYRYILFGAVTLFFFLIFFLNFWSASRYLGIDSESLDTLGYIESTRRRRFLELFKSGSMKAYVPLSLLLAIAIAAPFFKDWHAALLFVFGPESGVKDAVFGQDVSFYMFAYPVFQLIQVELLIAHIILTLAISLLYWLEHRITQGEQVRHWAGGAKIHLTLLVLLTTLILAWGFMLERYQLLYTDVHEPQFFGPGFMEINYYLPIIWVSVVALIGAVLSGLLFMHQRKGLTVSVALFLLFAAALGLPHLTAIPDAIDRFVVKPNPVKTEYDSMRDNIQATLSAYDLNGIKNIDISPGLPDQDVIDPELRSHLYNIPVWDPEFLDDVYQQMQGIRPYYHFTDVDIARYMVNGRLEQVNLAAREVNIKNLPAAAQNWENTHLRYTHGYGAVATPAAQDGQTPMNWYLQNLDMQSVGKGKFSVERPDIYYGEEDLPYAIVPNKLDIVGIPSADEQSSFNYTGSGGVPISSLFRKLLFALYYRDEKVFFSVNITGESRALFHRNIVDRVNALTPFLHLDHDPYIVLTPKRIFWVIDAYTTSDWYPVSRRSMMRFNHDKEDHQFNYIRNSVKVVVDAFDGHVEYYVSDAQDPIIRGYRKAYPGLFRDLNTLPPDLKNHLRYPKDLFVNQMKIYARYHQREPELFYEQAETWDFARVNDAPVKPYYLTTALEGYQSEHQNFVLINPMTPVGRSNLSVLGVAGTFTTGDGKDPGMGYDKQIVMYRFSRENQVDGPAQVSALIDQDPEIARQLTLWDQRGSRVLRGRIIVLPVGRSVLYVQPVYIVSTSGTRIPELQRIILSMGNVVVMNPSLEEGIQELEKRLKTMRDRAPARPETTGLPQNPTGPQGGPSLSPMR
jgi:uncharacterized membrane protein (UPF0182 family)